MAARCHFMISQSNPNERAGGGGCLCSEAKIADAEGPFVVFHGVETDNPFSPYAVLCAGCAAAGARESGVLEPLPEPEPAGFDVTQIVIDAVAAERVAARRK